MDALSISVTCLVILVIVFFLLIPKLRYKLSVRDGIRCYFNSRYQLFVFAHSRFGKVREGKQVYERYRDFVKALYNKDNFDKVKSEHQNNQTRINLSFLSDVVDDEQFVRRYFSEDSLSYARFLKMEEDWETRPVETEQPLEKNEIKVPNNVEEPEVSESNYKGKLTPMERRKPGSFTKLIVNLKKERSLMEWIDKTLKTINNGDEYAALTLALKQSTQVEFSSTLELYECINSSFQSKIKVNYNALTNAIKLYSEGACSAESEERINELINKFSSELNAI